MKKTVYVIRDNITGEWLRKYSPPRTIKWGSCYYDRLEFVKWGQDIPHLFYRLKHAEDAIKDLTIGCLQRHEEVDFAIHKGRMMEAIEIVEQIG